MFLWKSLLVEFRQRCMRTRSKSESLNTLDLELERSLRKNHKKKEKVVQQKGVKQTSNQFQGCEEGRMGTQPGRSLKELAIEDLGYKNLCVQFP